MRFFKTLWQKLLGPKIVRPSKHLTYDKTLITTSDGRQTLTEKGELERKLLLRTELQEGDTYQLGPEATAYVGPRGKKGKAWITARVKANEEKRQAKFKLWWADKREYCLKVMLMTDEELRASGIYQEVQEFLEENANAIQCVMNLGFAPELKERFAARQKEATEAPLPPSGVHSERIAHSFEEILRGTQTEKLMNAELLVDGKLADATPETVEKYKLLVGTSSDELWRPEGD